MSKIAFRRPIRVTVILLIVVFIPAALSVILTTVMEGAGDASLFQTPSIVAAKRDVLINDVDGDGMTSTDIGVSEPNTTPVGDSLQLGGTGTMGGDFAWVASQPNTFGAVNTGQTFGSAGTDLDTNNDGTFDVTPWSRIVDDVATTDGGGSDITYSSTVLGPFFDGNPFGAGGASRIPNGTDTDTIADWLRNDFGGFGYSLSRPFF